MDFLKHLYFRVFVSIPSFPMIQDFFEYFRGQIVQLPRKLALHQFKVQ